MRMTGGAASTVPRCTRGMRNSPRCRTQKLRAWPPGPAGGAARNARDMTTELRCGRLRSAPATRSVTAPRSSAEAATSGPSRLGSSGSRRQPARSPTTPATTTVWSSSGGGPAPATRLRCGAWRVLRPGRGLHHRSDEVVRMALENAVSVAGVLLLSEATMTEPRNRRSSSRRRWSRDLRGSCGCATPVGADDATNVGADPDPQRDARGMACA